MRTSLLLLLLSIFVTLSHAQQRTKTTSFILSGRVKDASSKAPLNEATISITGTSTGTHSDSTGIYHLTVPAGAHKFRFEFVGYVSVDTLLNISGDTKFNI